MPAKNLDLANKNVLHLFKKKYIIFRQDMALNFTITSQPQNNFF